MTRREKKIDLAAMLSVCESAPMRQAEISRRTGLTPSYIHNISTRKRGNVRPGYETVTAIKALYDSVALTIEKK